MELGMIGLGKMGGNMTTRLLQGGHRVAVYDRNEGAVRSAAKNGAAGASSVDELVSKLEESPRHVWVMVPSGDPTESTVMELAKKLSPSA